MTAASPACSPASSRSSSPLCLPQCPRHLRTGKVLRTQLPLRSAPGAWLLLGVVVVLVGMSVAVAGYVSAEPKPAGGRGSTHAERMKLTGPVVMGVGLFIFICAATLLYENRDREILRYETSDDLEDLKGGFGWDDSQEQPSFGCQEPEGEKGAWATPAHMLPLSNPSWGPSLPPALPHNDRHNISSRASADNGGQDGADRKEEEEKEEEEEDEGEEEEEGGSTLLTRVLHHQEPTPRPPSPGLSASGSSLYSDSCNSSEIHFNMRTNSPLPPQH